MRADIGDAETRIVAITHPSGSIESVDQPPPPFQTEPPFGRDFLAHLHGGYYDDDPAAGPVWDRVRADPDAAAFIAGLDNVQRILRDLDS